MRNAHSHRLAGAGFSPRPRGFPIELSINYPHGIVLRDGCSDFDITEIDITESDVTETDITENDITESDITESDIT